MKAALIAFLMSQPISDFDRQFMLATASVESGFKAHVLGDSGRSWGLFQFGRARWIESGGAHGDWARASHCVQTRAMIRALDNYKKQMPPRLTPRQQVIWLTNFHNRGTGSLELTPHVIKVLRALPEASESVKLAKLKSAPQNPEPRRLAVARPVRLTALSR